MRGKTDVTEWRICQMFLDKQYEERNGEQIAICLLHVLCRMMTMLRLNKECQLIRYYGSY